MASIHTFSVTVFAGRMHAALRRVAVLETPPGVNGNAVVRGAWKADICRIPTSTTVASQVAAEALIESYRALHGLQVRVIDQFGKTWLDTTVINVETDKSLTAVGTYRVDAIWQLLPQTIRPV